jgi:hypothetical protein
MKNVLIRKPEQKKKVILLPSPRRRCALRARNEWKLEGATELGVKAGLRASTCPEASRAVLGVPDGSE